MKIIGLTTLILTSIIASTIWRGYVLSILWGWFIVTAFGAKPLTIAAAIGVSCVVSFMTYQFHASPKETKGGSAIIAEGIGTAFIHPFFALIVGAIVKQWL